MSRSIFYGFGAWVGQTTGATRCGWWPADPSDPSINFDQAKLIETDLANNPSAHKAGRVPVSKIEVDDRPAHGGMTKIGPTFPVGSMINSVWLEQSHYDALPAAKKPPRVPQGMACFDYELTCVEYWAGPLANRKFYGFYAEIASEQGSLALVSVWPAGRSQVPGVGPMGAWWLDLALVAHPIEPGLTAIGVGPGSAKQGALFIEHQTTITTMADGTGPKLPAGSGHDQFPTR
ncbi:MAG: hypothetical protein M3680_18980 [Myxococcota bacterium]|nr:hypothetical protein [Myxococcota bacterium]